MKYLVMFGCIIVIYYSIYSILNDSQHLSYFYLSGGVASIVGLVAFKS